MFVLPFTYRNPNLDTCYLTLLQWSDQGIHVARHVTIFMKLAASFNLFNRGWGGPGGGGGGGA